jgi:alkylhydroperoxidase family enzyme
MEINMPSPRIVPLEAPFDDAVAHDFKRFLPPGLAPLKLFRTQAHNPRVMQRMFAGNLLDKGAIDARTRELVILRTCARCKSEYEWGVHVALFSKAANLSADDVAATLGGDADLLNISSQEKLLFKMVDELHVGANVSDALWNEVSLHYSSAQIIEIIALVGNYHAVSFITNAARVELEEWAPRFSAHS